MTAYTTESIHEGQIAQLVCPECNEPINVYTLEHILTPEGFEKLHKFQMRNSKAANAQEKLYRCPGVDCEYFVLIGEEIEKVSCLQH